MLYTVQSVLDNIDPILTEYLGIVLFTYILPFIGYSAVHYISIKTKDSPWYFWMHAYYFGHDLTFTLLFHHFCSDVGNWIFAMMSVMCAAFTLFELFGLWIAVKNERQHLWGQFYKKPVTFQQGLVRGGLTYLFNFVLVFSLYFALQDMMMLILMLSTNVVVCCGTASMIERHIARGNILGRKTSYFLVVLSTLGSALVTFLPPGWGMWTTATRFFDAPWFYILGALCVFLMARCTSQLVKAYSPRASAATPSEPAGNGSLGLVDERKD